MAGWETWCDVAIAGPDRDYVTALIFPNIDACRSICADARDARLSTCFETRPSDRESGTLGRLACESVGLSTSVVRAILMDQPPSIDAHRRPRKAPSTKPFLRIARRSSTSCMPNVRRQR